MKFESLYLELVESTDMIRALLAGITQAESTIKPGPVSWSVLETLCHLYDEEREDFREHLDFILNRQTGAWHRIDPEGWVHQRKYNERDFKEMKERFFAERSQSLDWLKGLADADWQTPYTSEGTSMTAGEMLGSWVAHDNLALRQFVELRRARIERLCEPYSIAYAGGW